MLPPLPRWIAHRGGGSLAPENTLLGIRRAAVAGYQAVEFDVMLNADATPVLIHDETLERTTNGRGQVSTTPDQTLFALDAGEGETIPRFADAAVLCRQSGLLANVEIKPAQGMARQTAEVVTRAALQHWAGAELAPLLSSFSLEALAIARDLAPHLPRGLLLENLPANWPQLARELAVHTLHCPAAVINEPFMAEARALGLPVLVFTVNDEKQAKMLFGLGVQGVFTDTLRPETTAYKALQSAG
ncbi:MAG: glycerophosphodiester phosphodiesterase [Rhodocyclales bacterium]|nr:glycerophosphodiester phosphodiesterase [Rhodocyclales bacterium]